MVIGEIKKVREVLEEAKVKIADSEPAAGLAIRIPTIKKVGSFAEQAVTNARQYLMDIPDHMAGLVVRIRGIRSASPEEQTIRSKELKALEDEVLEHLNSGEELLANAARQTFALAMASTMPADKRLVAETINGNSRLPGLLELKILEVGNDKNAVTVKVYGDTYKVNGGREYTLRLAKALAEGAARAAKAAHELYHSEAESLKAQATISIAETKARKSGCFFLDVPDLKKDGKFLPGGALLAESDGVRVKVLEACGHFQRIMTEIAEAKTFVSLGSLGSQRLELDTRLSEDAFRRVRILHAILRRGIAEAQKTK